MFRGNISNVAAFLGAVARKIKNNYTCSTHRYQEYIEVSNIESPEAGTNMIKKAL